jgi:hypothetical protein
LLTEPPINWNGKSSIARDPPRLDRGPREDEHIRPIGLDARQLVGVLLGSGKIQRINCLAVSLMPE